jgi:manganese transport system permease protein
MTAAVAAQTAAAALAGPIGTVVTWFAEPLTYDFMLRAMAVTAVAALVCALLSCWLVLIGWSLMGDAVSHAVLPGVVLAYIVGAPFAVGAVVFGLLAVLLIGIVRDTSRIKEDAVIGIVFTALFALGIVLVSVTPSHVDLGHIVFGNLLGVSTAVLVQVALLAAVVVAVLLLKRRDLALTAVVALQAVGVILVVAMLIIPGATARLLTDSFGRMLVLAPTVAVASSLAGAYLSYWWDTSAGGMVVLAQAAVFALVYLFAPPEGVVTGRLRARRRAAAAV